MNILELKNISHAYPQPDGQSVTVLKDACFSLASSESASVSGPSGSGKTTLIHIAGTLLVPCEGRVHLFDKDAYALSSEELASLRREHISFIFQAHSLMPHLSALENVLLPFLAEKNAVDNEIIARAKALFKEVSMEHKMKAYPEQMSGGECQRIACLRAFIREPALLIADEPTGSLDRANAADVADMLFHLCKEHKTALVLVTHDENLAARANSRYHIENGHLIRL